MNRKNEGTESQQFFKEDKKTYKKYVRKNAFGKEGPREDIRQ